MVADLSTWVEAKRFVYYQDCEFCGVKDCKVRFAKYDVSVSALCNALIAILQSS